MAKSQVSTYVGWWYVRSGKRRIGWAIQRINLTCGLRGDKEYLFRSRFWIVALETMAGIDRNRLSHKTLSSLSLYDSLLRMLETELIIKT